MKRTERYLQRATLGLWGQRRTDVRAELRGAVEDKLYRYQLLGLSPEAAETAALRDLGSPHRLAWSLGLVHTGTTTLRLSLLLGMAGLLSLQAVAQVATVKSAFRRVEASHCQLPSPSAFKTPADRAKYDRFLATYGGPEQFLAQCRAGMFSGNAFLKVSDLLAALNAGNIHPQLIPELTPTTLLTILGPGGTPQISFQTENLDGQRYFDSSMVLPFLIRATSLPLTLTGLKNPVIRIGEVTIQLGTPAAPVWTADLLSSALQYMRQGNANFPLPVVTGAQATSLPLDPDLPRLGVPGQDGDFFAVIQNGSFLRTDGERPETLWVSARQHGRIPFTDEAGTTFRLVNSQDELDQMTARKIKAAVVYRLDLHDLRQIQLVPVPSTQVRVVPGI